MKYVHCVLSWFATSRIHHIIQGYFNDTLAIFCRLPLKPMKSQSNWIRIKELKKFHWSFKIALVNPQSAPVGKRLLIESIDSILIVCHTSSKTKENWLIILRKMALAYDWYDMVFMHITMTSSNGNIFRVTGLLCGEFTGHRWIFLTRDSDVDLWCFLWFVPE